MYVIQGRLTEEDVLRLGEWYFSKLSSCCTKLVLIDIKRYLSSTNKNTDCARLVEKVFANQLFLADVVKDKVLMDAIKTVESLQYDSVSADVDMTDLQYYKECLEKIKNCQYSQPYRSAITSAYIKDVIQLYKDGGFKDIAKKLESAKGLFSEPVNARAVGTPFKTINYAEERLSVIRPGLDFLIRMKEKGISPLAWRHL